MISDIQGGQKIPGIELSAFISRPHSPTFAHIRHIRPCPGIFRCIYVPVYIFQNLTYNPSTIPSLGAKQFISTLVFTHARTPNFELTYATGQREILVSETLQSEERPMINQQFIEPFHWMFR
jgi:hypothetical protein